MPGPLDPLTSVDDPCRAQAVQHLIGAPVPSVEEIRAMGGPQRIRVIRPGQPVTMDHVPVRLNVVVDDDGIVQSLRCG